MHSVDTEVDVVTEEEAKLEGETEVEVESQIESEGCNWGSAKLLTSFKINFPAKVTNNGIKFELPSLLFLF